MTVESVSNLIVDTAMQVGIAASALVAVALALMAGFWGGRMLVQTIKGFGGGTSSEMQAEADNDPSLRYATREEFEAAEAEAMFEASGGSMTDEEFDEAFSEYEG